MGIPIPVVNDTPTVKTSTKLGKPKFTKGKRIGIGWVVSDADFQVISKIIKAAGIEFDEDDPASGLRALNLAKHKDREKVADKLADKLGTKIDRDNILSDIEQAMIQYDKEKAKFSKHVEAIADKMYAVNKGILEKRWKNPDAFNKSNASKYVAWDIEETGEQQAETAAATLNPPIGPGYLIPSPVGPIGLPGHVPAGPKPWWERKPWWPRKPLRPIPDRRPPEEEKEVDYAQGQGQGQGQGADRTDGTYHPNIRPWEDDPGYLPTGEPVNPKLPFTIPWGPIRPLPDPKWKPTTPYGIDNIRPPLPKPTPGGYKPPPGWPVPRDHDDYSPTGKPWNPIRSGQGRSGVGQEGQGQQTAASTLSPPNVQQGRDTRIANVKRMIKGKKGRGQERSTGGMPGDIHRTDGDGELDLDWSPHSPPLGPQWDFEQYGPAGFPTTLPGLEAPSWPIKPKSKRKRPRPKPTVPLDPFRPGGPLDPNWDFPIPSPIPNERPKPKTPRRTPRPKQNPRPGYGNPDPRGGK